MDKKIKIYLAIFVLAIAWILYADASKKKPINWYPAFTAKHKIPYGTHILRNELNHLFPNTQIRDMRRPPYVMLKDSSLQGTYIFVNNIVNFGTEEMNELLDFVKKGNDVFVSTLGANVDTLKLKTRSVNSTGIKETRSMVLANPSFLKDSIEVKNDVNKVFFAKVDTLETEILGHMLLKKEQDSVPSKHVNFVRRKFGKGHFYFHVYPYVFTNYYVIDQTKNAYVAAALSYINPDKPILWDAYYKTGKDRISTPMYYVLNSKSLKWAYYVLIAGILLFVIFQGKRNQRFIPIIEPLKNQTIAFTKTIASLYFERKDHKAIAQKHIFHLLDFIRTQLNIPTEDINQVFYEFVSARSGNTVDEVEALFALIQQLEQQKTITKEQLIQLNTKIERFKQTYQSL